MKYIRTFESHRTVKGNLKAINPSILEEAIKESVINVGDIYKVRSMVDIPQSLINSYVKKVKDTTGKNLRQFFGDVEIAEELVKHITTTGLEIDKIAGNALMGGAQSQGQTTAQTTTEQPQVQVDTQAETQPVQEVPAQAQEVPQTTQEVPQTTQEVPQSTQETPQAVAQPSAQFEEPAQAQEGQAPVAQEEEEEKEDEDEEEEELPL